MKTYLFFALSTVITFCLASAFAVDANTTILHEGPDPICHWVFNGRTVSESRLEARLGPDGTIEGEYTVDNENGILLNSNDSAIVVAENFADLKPEYLPQKDFTISAWFTVNERITWGSIACAMQDNGSFEKGWVLGYNQRNFYIGLSTEGANDGDGLMTYLTGSTDYELGKFYHVVAAYDGTTLQLFVNGKLDSESTVQSGKILYPESAPLVLGSYRDDDESEAHQGRITEIAVYDLAAKPEWVAKEFEHNANLTQVPTMDIDEKLEFVVPPYLQMGTKSSMTVGWQTGKPAKGSVRYGETAEVTQVAEGQAGKFVQHVKLDGLKINTQYFYRVESTDSDGKKIEGEVLTFQTAPDSETPFAFAIISDTQDNKKVSGIVAEMAWAQRPNFMIHPGDLVGTGSNDRDWTQEFFPAMHPLIGRVPMYPVLGNHEQNAKNYYDYFQLPEPEYYYEFEYGNSHFFMIDTNKNVGPDSEQYKWLDTALSKCTAKWKFVVHHHPPYSSDENDYGDLWKSNKSTRGDLRARQLAKLYDKHSVDIVWNGHIHSYERTWPVFDESVTPGKGTIYMVTGGGGGSLETPGPYRTFFENTVKHGHHYCMAYVNGGVLEFKAFDLEGRLFDYMKLDKK
jgi:3',5'-cyclic AMP phosphodiesterase CpdA